jgi:mono/diheme cytochrome c family protein
MSVQLGRGSSILVYGSFAVLLGSAYSLPAVAAGDADSGKTLYDQDCKKCHGANGEGNEGIYKMLKADVVPLGSAQAKQRSDAEIKKIMTDGFGKMKPVKDLSPSDLDDLLAYTRSLK